ncbi:tetratricopeptide repeat protein [Ferruginibacter yonginensis]|uniref:Tetratricopeptide repeat protein n=1 Tax=Ferruginibacter yonginensis TaxID=1310416 RepID=A0ABV8QPS8_9BACT
MNRIEQLNNLLLTNANDSFLQHALALEHIKLGDDDKALVLFTNILKVNEDYVGSYYHLAKLYERMQQLPMAVETYKKGMMIAKKLKDQHAYNEMQGALEDVEDADE